MTQKKDRRSARTRKRDDEVKSAINKITATIKNQSLPLWMRSDMNMMQELGGVKCIVRSIDGARPDFRLSTPGGFRFTADCLSRMPSFPASHSSSAPMAPEVSQ